MTLPVDHIIQGDCIEKLAALPGQELRLNKANKMALAAAGGALIYEGQRGSIHQIGTQLMGAPCNGWAHWQYWDEAAGAWVAVDVLRKKLQ